MKQGLGAAIGHGMGIMPVTGCILRSIEYSIPHACICPFNNTLPNTFPSSATITDYSVLQHAIICGMLYHAHWSLNGGL